MGARERPPTLAQQLRPRGHRFLQRSAEGLEQPVVRGNTRSREHVAGDLEIRSAGQREGTAGRLSRHRFERLHESVAAKLRRIDEGPVDVPEHEAAERVLARHGPEAIWLRAKGTA